MDLLSRIVTGFLHWFWGTLIWIAVMIALGVTAPWVLGNIQIGLLAAGILGAYGLWSVFYLPIRFLALGYKGMKIKCGNCGAEWEIHQCENCHSRRFLDNQCMRCGQYFGRNECGQCNVHGMIRARASW